MATIENHGGVMISVVHSPGSGWTNLVVLAHVEIITNTQNFQQRPQAIVKPTGEIGRSNFIATVPGRQAIIAKLKQIRLAEFSSAGLPLSEVLRRLSEQSLLRETNHAGINFLTDDQFLQVYQSVMAKGKHEFMIIDYKAPMENRFRHRFTKILKVKSLDETPEAEFADSST